jgi:hypothetical protein
MLPSCALLRKKPEQHVATRPARIFNPPTARPGFQQPPPELTDPPVIEAELPSWELALHFPPPELPEPPQRPPAQRLSKPESSKEEAEAIEEAAQPPLQLGQILTSEQRKQYNHLIDQDLNQALKSLAALSGRSMTSEQVESATLIQTFIRQARENRDQDPIRARNLAERAALLAQHLEKNVR